MRPARVIVLAAISVLALACGSAAPVEVDILPSAAPGDADGSKDDAPSPGPGTSFGSGGETATCAGEDGYDQEGCACPADGQTQNCFVGDATKAGVGSCTWGKQTCSRRGEFLQWGACVGSGAPTPAACDGIDHQCNGKIDEGCECRVGETKSCYSGPAGTEGVGLCKAGKQTCIAAQGGPTWGGCVGQVIPARGETTCKVAAPPPPPPPPQPCAGNTYTCPPGSAGYGLCVPLGSEAHKRQCS